MTLFTPPYLKAGRRFIPLRYCGNRCHARHQGWSAVMASDRRASRQISQSPHREMSLVESILAHHQELGLDEAQFNAISKLFWSQSQDMNDIATISEVAKSLTSDQFCRAVALLTPQFATNPHQPAALDSTIEGFV